MNLVKDSKAEEQEVMNRIHKLQKEMFDRAYENCSKRYSPATIQKYPYVLSDYYLAQIAGYMANIEYDKNNSPFFYELERLRKTRNMSLAEQLKLGRDKFDIRLANVFLDKKSGSCETISGGAVLLSVPPDSGDTRFVRNFKNYIQYKAGLLYGMHRTISTNDTYGAHDVFLVDKQECTDYKVMDYVYDKYKKFKQKPNIDMPVSITKYNEIMKNIDLVFFPSYMNLYNRDCPQTRIYQSMAISDCYQRGITPTYKGRNVYGVNDLNTKI